MNLPKLIIHHRVNHAELLNSIPAEDGVELDLRTDAREIIVHHDAFSSGENFRQYLKAYQHSFIILNTKCEGLEEALISLMAKEKISEYFFLDLSIPFLVKTIRQGCSKVAVRFSEYEPLSFVKEFEGKADWVWVDCFTRNCLTDQAYDYLSRHFKICIVSPELQGHPKEWITEFRELYKNYRIDAVCTKYPSEWR